MAAGIVKLCPTIINELLRLFAFMMALTDTPYFSARTDKLSPLFTVILVTFESVLPGILISCPTKIK